MSDVFHIADVVATFDTWHTGAKTSYGIPVEGIPITKNGVIDESAPTITEYSEFIPHLTEPLKGYWHYGDFPDGGLAKHDRDSLVTLGYVNAIVT